MSNHEFLTPEETAALLKVSPDTLRVWRREGKGPQFHRLGHRTVRYSRPQLEAWMTGSTATKEGAL